MYYRWQKCLICLFFLCSAVDGKHNTLGLCDPENPKSCTAKSSQRCEDDDGDGHEHVDSRVGEAVPEGNTFQ